MQVKDYHEQFPHRADIGVRGVGATLERAFEQAALALMEIYADPSRVVERESIPIHCSAPDPELLLVDWLNALIYEMSTRHMLFRRFSVRIAGDSLDALAYGEALDPHRHSLGTEVKGATYTQLEVARRPDGSWLAQCVVDV